MKKDKVLKVTASRALCILLVAALVANLLMWGFATDWGFTSVKRINIVGDDGLTYSALMVVPKTATNKTPAPAFIGCHGASADARAMETWGLEMGRRGYVSLMVDTSGCGGSERFTTSDNGGNIYITDTQPLECMFQYLLDSNIVRSDDISIAGISAGCVQVAFMARKYPANIKTAIYIAGSRPYSDHENLPCNMLMMVGTSDTVMQPGKNGVYVDGTLQYMYEYFEEVGITSNDQIVQDQLYGSYEEGTARMFSTTKMTHAAGTFNHACISKIAEFIMDSTGIANVPHYVNPDNSAWELREAFGLISVILYLLALCAFATVLLSTSFFSKIKQPRPAVVGLQKGQWWFSALCGIVIAIILWQLKPSARISNDIFPGYYMNTALIWMAYMTVFGIVMFFVFHFTWGKKQGGNLKTYGILCDDGIEQTVGVIGRAFVLAIIVILVGVSYLSALEDITGLTPHFWFINYSPVVLHRVKYIPAYFVCYFAAFFFSGLGMNIERALPDTGNETKDMIRALIINIVVAAGGVTLIYLVQWAFGYSAMTEPGLGNMFAKLSDHSQFALPVTIATAAGINTYFYRKTGSIWTGVTMSSLLITVNGIMNNALSGPAFK